MNRFEDWGYQSHSQKESMVRIIVLRIETDAVAGGFRRETEDTSEDYKKKWKGRHTCTTFSIVSWHRLRRDGKLGSTFFDCLSHTDHFLSHYLLMYSVNTTNFYLQILFFLNCSVG